MFGLQQGRKHPPERLFNKGSKRLKMESAKRLNHASEVIRRLPPKSADFGGLFRLFGFGLDGLGRFFG